MTTYSAKRSSALTVAKNFHFDIVIIKAITRLHINKISGDATKMDSDTTFVACVEPISWINLFLTYFTPVLIICFFSIAKRKRMVVVFVAYFSWNSSTLITHSKYACSAL